MTRNGSRIFAFPEPPSAFYVESCDHSCNGEKLFGHLFQWSRVAFCLSRLGFNSELRIISNLFGVGLSTTFLHEVCRAVVDHLAAKYIHFPTGQGLRTIVDVFESKWGFPQCTGAIDGSHIPIIAPSETALDYYN